jgi:two-component system, response regulator FlrC
MDQALIGIVESERRIFDRIGKILIRQGYGVRKIAPAEVSMWAADCHLFIAADPLQDPAAAELMACMDQSGSAVPVILAASSGSVNQVVTAMRRGVQDYLLLSDEDELILKSIEGAIAQRSGKKSVAGQKAVPDIVSKSPAMRALLDMARRIASSSATVLIQGESGTGKELIARFIHSNSDRRHQRWVAMNCAALPENLAESELFGHEKGAFTGALQRKIGKFEQAHNGTLLLDEIGEMSLALQAKLLRVLQEKEVDRIGGQKPVPLNVRVIATTHRDLNQLVAGERFRKDLYYRLRIVPLVIPPLRERPEDIPPLHDHFILKFRNSSAKPLPGFTAAAMEKMMRWSWPGNVRELENAVERALLMCDSDSIGPEWLLLDENSEADGEAVRAAWVGMTVRDLEERLIVQTLKHVNHNRTHAAEMLGISIRTLRNKLREYRQDEESTPFPQARTAV